MKLFMKSAVLLLIFFVTAVSRADTLMLQVVVNDDKHSLLKAWVTPRNVAPAQNQPSKMFIQVVAYNDVGGQVYEYFMEDQWKILEARTEAEKIDHFAPESYVLKIPSSADVARVEVSRGNLGEGNREPKLENVLIIDRSW